MSEKEKKEGRLGGLLEPNPALSKGFSDVEKVDGNTMTISGTVNKLAILFLLTLISAIYTWNLYYTSGGESILPLMLLGLIGGFIVSLVTIFIPKVSPFSSPVYAVLEGLALGGISAFFEAEYAGITIQAVIITFSVLIMMLLIYKARIISVNQNFKIGVVAATGAVALTYLIDIVLSFFGLNVPFIHDSGILGIGISLVIIAIAALNFVLDFDFIENGAEAGYPKYMEWYGAFGLLLTLFWLYLEALRLLRKIRD